MGGLTFLPFVREAKGSEKAGGATPGGGSSKPPPSPHGPPGAGAGAPKLPSAPTGGGSSSSAPAPAAPGGASAGGGAGGPVAADVPPELQPLAAAIAAKGEEVCT
jgi:hypothetical protein